jgi:ribosomal protein S12 methylthiotransferase
MSRTRTVYLETLGCEKNLVDSQSAMGLLLGSGFSPTPEPRGADLLVLNTCGFLQAAREESLDRIRELGAQKGGGTLVVMGCFVQGATHPITELVPEVDHVLGVGQYDQLAGLLARDAHAIPLASPEEAPYAGYGVRALLGPTHVAHLKIAEGCNQSCSFCKIPVLRGKQRSRPLSELVAEARALAGLGVRELILIAQNTTAYGIDLPQRPRLPQLCAALSEVDGIEWLRVMYAYPAMFTDRLMDETYALEKVVSYLDIPVQHASPPVLEAMDRGYDIERFLRQLERLRGLRPDIMLRSTALLGFPGETEDDVVALLDFLAEARLDHLGTFVYSHEENTPAFGRRDDVDSEEKEDRRARVEDLQWDISLERKGAMLGRSLEVVVDEVFEDPAEADLSSLPCELGEDPRGAWSGGAVAFARSEGFCHEIDGGIWLPASGLTPGDTLRVVPVGCGPYDLYSRPEVPSGGTSS